MHELALCQGLISAVERTAAEHRAHGVSRVELLLGPLSGAEGPLLKRAFLVARAGTIAENADLVIIEAPVTVECHTCGKASEVPPSRLLCSTCGGWQVRVTSGEELLLKSIELTDFEADMVNIN